MLLHDNDKLFRLFCIMYIAASAYPASFVDVVNILEEFQSKQPGEISLKS